MPTLRANANTGTATWTNGVPTTQATAITAATVLTLDDSGGIFTVDQGAAYDIDLPSPTVGPGVQFLFQLVGPAAFDVTITVLVGAATFAGTIIDDTPDIVAAAGATLTFVNTTAALGDWIEVISVATNLYTVRAVSSAAGGITCV